MEFQPGFCKGANREQGKHGLKGAIFCCHYCGRDPALGGLPGLNPVLVCANTTVYTFTCAMCGQNSLNPGGSKIDWLNSNMDWLNSSPSNCRSKQLLKWFFRKEVNCVQVPEDIYEIRIHVHDLQKLIKPSTLVGQCSWSEWVMDCGRTRITGTLTPTLRKRTLLMSLGGWNTTCNRLESGSIDRDTRQLRKDPVFAQTQVVQTKRCKQEWLYKSQQHREERGRSWGPWFPVLAMKAEGCHF